MPDPSLTIHQAADARDRAAPAGSDPRSEAFRPVERGEEHRWRYDESTWRTGSRTATARANRLPGVPDETGPSARGEP